MEEAKLRPDRMKSSFFTDFILPSPQNPAAPIPRASRINSQQYGATKPDKFKNKNMYNFTVKVSDIEYDAPESVKPILPKSFPFVIDAEGQDDLEEKIADKISDITGFCHYHFSYKILKIS